MKILWVSNKELDISASRSSRLEMTKQLVQLGHEVTMMGRYRRTRQRFSGIEDVIYVPTLNFPGCRESSFLLLVSFYLLRIIWLRKPDIVIVDRERLAVSIILARLITALFWSNIKFVLDIRSPSQAIDRPGLAGRSALAVFRLALIFTNRFCHGLTTISFLLRDLIVEQSNCSEKEIGLWTSGVSPNLFDPGSVVPAPDAPAADPFTIFYHGNVGGRELDKVILAVEQINRLGALEEKVFLFILSSSTGIAELKALVHKLGAQSYVQFHDAVPYQEVPRYLCNASLGIVPIPDTLWFRTSVPLKLIEYMAMAKPAIVSHVGFVKYQLEPTADILPVAHDSSGGMCLDSLIEALQAGYTWWRKIKSSSSNRTIATTQYSWAVQAKALEGYLQRVMYGS